MNNEKGGSHKARTTVHLCFGPALGYERKSSVPWGLDISWSASLPWWYPLCGTQSPHLWCRGNFKVTERCRIHPWRCSVIFLEEHFVFLSLKSNSNSNTKIILTQIRQPVRKINNKYINSCKCMALRKVLNLVNFQLSYYQGFATKI